MQINWTPNLLEISLQNELIYCENCQKEVHTIAAEGVPAQQLRACKECDNVFFMDLNSIPKYA
jgi:hypothetical protein